MKNTDNHDERVNAISILKNRMNTIATLVIIFCIVGTIFIYSSIMSQAQQTASSVTINTSTTNPFGGAYEGPPRIALIYNNTEYYGVLDSYSFEKGETIGEIPMFNDKITSTLPNQTITVEKGSTIRFTIKGNAPPEAQSDSLSVNAYTINGKPAKVLKVADELQKTSFVVDLQEGREYILMAIATWLPEEDTENISGYVSYSYRVNVIN